MDAKPSWLDTPLLTYIPADDDDPEHHKYLLSAKLIAEARTTAAGRYQPTAPPRAQPEASPIPTPAERVRAPPLSGATEAHADAFIADRFTANISATKMDDGGLWIDLGSLRLLARHTHSRRAEPEHVPGEFPSPVWQGRAEFERTTTGLWTVSLADGTRFTLIVSPPGRSRGPEKLCRSCHTSRPVAFFSKSPRSPDGLQHVCTSCSGVARPSSKRRSTEAQRRRLRAITAPPPGFKACVSCGTVKPASTKFFGPDRRTRDGLQHRCRECSGTVQALVRVREREARMG